MIRRNTGLALCLLLLSQTASALPYTFDARSLGMGSVAVATADLSTAPWANPSMLARQKLGDKFSLLIGLGAFIRDDDDLLGDIDDFQGADDARKAARKAGDSAAEARAILDMRLIVRGLEDKVIAPEATLLFSMGLARDGISVAFSARSDVIAAGTVTNLSCPLIEDGCNPDELLSEDFNILSLQGVQSTEFGLSVARNFTISEQRLSFGIKPKVVDLRALVFREPIIAYDDYWDESYEDIDLGTFATFDMGFAADLGDHWLLGLSLRNLLTDEFDVGNQVLDFDTEVTLGLSYDRSSFTLGIDVDLVENEPSLPSGDFDALRRQRLAVGVELRAGDFVRLRAGAGRNIASGIPDGAKDVYYTLGLGLRYGFKFDVSAIVNDHSIGALLQAGFRF